jgi:hypothetical protein
MFIRAPRDAVADCLVRWGNEERVKRGTKLIRTQMPLAEAFNHLMHLKPIPNRAFVISMVGGWTAFFNNQQYQFLAQAELYILCRRLEVDTCFFSYNDDPQSPQHGSAHFCHAQFRGGEFPVNERQVMVYKESDWVFSASGEPLPYEDLEAYVRRRKSERLDAALLRRYGEALKLPFWDVSAYCQDVALLSWGDTKPADKLSALKRVIKIFGQPSLIRQGRRDSGE